MSAKSEYLNILKKLKKLIKSRSRHYASLREVELDLKEMLAYIEQFKYKIHLGGRYHAHSYMGFSYRP